jgi:hypothetical protein
VVYSVVGILLLFCYCCFFAVFAVAVNTAIAIIRKRLRG